MKRLGKFTGKIYGDGFDASKIEECCTLLSDKDAKDEEYIREHHAQDLLKCLSCMSCPVAQKCKN